MARRIAKLPIATELLIAALHLPEDTQILNATFSHDLDAVEFLIAQKDLREVQSGCAIPRTKPVIGLKTDPDNLVPNREVIFHGWD